MQSGKAVFVPHARTSAGWQSVAAGGVHCKILINAYNFQENDH